MYSNRPAIRVKTLSKKYTLGGPQEKYLTFRDMIINSLKAPFRRFHRGPSDEGFWALRDVSFDIEQGQVVGIIGRNGAGKSTLLKILSRITAPTEGTVELHGRVGSLLEVGTGFHPEMTGRENIFLNGSILGMKKIEIEQKFDEIVKFADVDKFIDTPVKRYSSGMYVRLAFAVAAHLDPEILVVDEVLAVGDVTFQNKCIGKMHNLSKTGKTILFVSHNLTAINRLTDSCIVLDKGKIVFTGPTISAIDYYLHSISSQQNTIRTEGFIDFHPRIDSKVQFIQVSIHNKESVITGFLYYQEDFEIRMRIRINDTIAMCYVGFTIENSRHDGIFRVTDDDTQEPFLSGAMPGVYEYRFKVPGCWLRPDKYWLSIFIGPHDIDGQNCILMFEIEDVSSRRALGNPPEGRGYYDYPVTPEIKWDAVRLSKENDT